MKVAGHQPNFIPVPTFFDKIQYVDKFVIHDEMEISTGNDAYQLEQKILTWNGPLNLKVPAKIKGETFRSSSLKNDSRMMQNALSWKEYHLMQIALSYGAASKWQPDEKDQEQIFRYKMEDRLRQFVKSKPNAPNFKRIYSHLESLYRQNHESLSEFNINLINLIRHELNVTTDIYYGCNMNLDVSVLDYVDNAIRTKGPIDSKNEIKEGILWLRNHVTRTYTLPIENAVCQVIDEYMLNNKQDSLIKLKFAATARVIREAQILECDTHVAGQGSNSYSVNSLYAATDIKKEIFHNDPKPYPQIHSNAIFIPYISAIDLIMNMDVRKHG